ncbi:long-chain fatty acid--CoA ligase [Nitriliruptoraceae bacterium ZYF776]|nr:long-chain fatty acid--CoA ligase [Profundirhabdus halotolerans]
MARPSERPDPAQLPDPATVPRPWIGGYPPGVPPTYAVPAVALPRLLDDAARDFPERAAVLVEGRETSYVELRDHVDALAAGLAEHGVAAGDRVLVAVPTTEVAPVALFALWRLGAVAVPVDPELRSDRLAAVVRDADVAAALVTDGARRSLRQEQARPPLVVRVDGDEHRPEGRWRDRLRDRLPRPGRRATATTEDPTPGTLALRDLVRGSVPRTATTPPVASDLALLAYRPRARELRGVELTHGNLVANAFQGRLWAPDVQAGRERILVTDPLHLTVPLTLGVLTGVLAAATLVLVDRPDAAALARAVDRDAPTLWPTGPDRLVQLLAADDAHKRDLTSLRVVVTGGGPLPATVAAELERRTGGARVREGYGLAEASPLTHAQPVYGKVVPGSIGLPVTDTVALVVDADDLVTPCAVGEPGMLLVHGPQVAAGYWRRPEATAAAFRDGYVVTGDLAVVDEAGVFTLIGRVDEVVRRDGELVAPRDVEAVLERHPTVARAVVVTDGDDAPLIAAVVARRRRRLDPAALLDHCRAHLAATAVPDHVEVLDELPEDDAGEVARDQVRRQLVGR